MSAALEEGRTEAQRRYDEYLQSEHWQTMRERALSRWGSWCQRCGYQQPRFPSLPLLFARKREFGADGEAPLYDDGLPTPFSVPDPIFLASDPPVRAIHVHHLTYRRRGREDVAHDFAVLCDDCHLWAHSWGGPRTIGPPGWEDGMQEHGQYRFACLLKDAGREVATDYAATFEANANKWLLWNHYRPQFELRVAADAGVIRDAAT